MSYPAAHFHHCPAPTPHTLPNYPLLCCSTVRREALGAVMMGRQLEARVVNVDEQSGRVVLSGGAGRCSWAMHGDAVGCSGEQYACPALPRPALAHSPEPCPALLRSASPCPAMLCPTFPTLPCPTLPFQSVLRCPPGRTAATGPRLPRRRSCRQLRACWGTRWTPQVRCAALCCAVLCCAAGCCAAGCCAVLYSAACCLHLGSLPCSMHTCLSFLCTLDALSLPAQMPARPHDHQ